MIALLVRKLVLTLFLALLVMGALERFNPSPPPLFVEDR